MARRFRKRFTRTNASKTTRWVGANYLDNIVSNPGDALQSSAIYTMVSAQDYAQGNSGEIENAGATLLRSIMHINIDCTVLLEDDVALTRDTALVSMALVVLNANDTVNSPITSAAMGLEDYLWTCQRAIRLCTNAAGNLRSNELPERPYQISETFDVKVKRRLDNDFVGLLVDVETQGNPDPTTVFACDILGTTRCLLGGRF